MSKPYPSVTRKALRENPNPKEVANELGIDLSTVYRHAKGMDLKQIRGLKEIGIPLADAIGYQFHDGVKPSKLAKQFGVSISYVMEVAYED